MAVGLLGCGEEGVASGALVDGSSGKLRGVVSWRQSRVRRGKRVSGSAELGGTGGCGWGSEIRRGEAGEACLRNRGKDGFPGGRKHVARARRIGRHDCGDAHRDDLLVQREGWCRESLSTHWMGANGSRVGGRGWVGG